ncbi:MAG: cobyrinate a,c-diamide synthase [Hespellia sp.]|nr:cobyrinate a,c-diamide synthase [Hespellia sp.]
MKIPRFMIAAASSGSGKTVISCGLMAAFLSEGKKVAACKCGPDYIDPMFHREVLGVDSENLDLFFCERQVMRALFVRHAMQADITVMEGVMGYYDGMMLGSDEASSYDVATALETPVILVVPCKGMALSSLAVIKGMLEFRETSQIKGLLLNRISGMLYPRMKQMIEDGLAQMGYEIPVIGYVPEDEVFRLESRHLGLVTPEEVGELKARLMRAGEILQKTVDMKGLEKIAEKATSFCSEDFRAGAENTCSEIVPEKSKPRIGVARDLAFSFYYKDNLAFLEEGGCKLVLFSPLRDKKLPEDLHGLILGGGYPELYAKELSQNQSMLLSIKNAIQSDLPCIAECGGFMYLQNELEGTDHISYPMAGVIDAKAYRMEHLSRFGYVNIQSQRDGRYLKKGEWIKGHEFHYWDSTQNGTECLAVKPDGKRTWECIHMEGNLFAGYPHIHFYSNPAFVERFVDVCKKRM